MTKPGEPRDLVGPPWTAAEGPPVARLAGVKAILFDLDDTLINWRAAEHAALGEVVQAHLAPLGIAEEQARSVYWGIMQDNFAAFRATKQWWYIGDRLGLLRSRLGLEERIQVDPLKESFSQAVHRHLALLPGALEALEAANRGGRKTALLTNGPSLVQRPKVQGFLLHEKVHFVGISGELGHWKPDALAFRTVLDRLGVAPDESAMVGDSLVFDIEPAKALGMTTVWVDPELRASEHADIVVADPAGLVKHLR